MEGYNIMLHDVGSDDTFKFSLLLFTLSNKPETLPYRDASTVNLMKEILSKNNYIYLVAQLDHVSDAENLLNLIRHWLQNHSLLNHDPANVDMNRRARRLMLAVISRIHDVPPSNIPHDPDDYLFPLLLGILSNLKLKSPVPSVNEIIISLVSEILSREDYYITLASQVNQFSDAMNLLESITHMLDRNILPNRDSATIDMNRRARRLMLTIISKMCGEPQSLNIPYGPHSDMVPSLFYILRNVELGYHLATNELAVNLMSEILSREDNTYSEAGLCHNSEAMNLFKFILRRLIYHTSIQNFDNADLKGQANRFILEVTAKTQGISFSDSSLPWNPRSKTFRLIIALLNESEPSTFFAPIQIDVVIRDLICEILSREDYIDIAAQLDNARDATNL
ncbi:hypothetical protein F5887DRAFT_459142 [Amanita rubescens]|nr:hypothetical protein F5887DRAFT_459142 [Amanita rubescens]